MWIGRNGLLFSDDPLVLDLETAKVRLLLPAGAVTGGVSSHGNGVPITADDDSLHWGGLAD